MLETCLPGKGTKPFSPYMSDQVWLMSANLVHVFQFLLINVLHVLLFFGGGTPQLYLRRMLLCIYIYVHQAVTLYQAVTLHTKASAW